MAAVDVGGAEGFGFFSWNDENHGKKRLVVAPCSYLVLEIQERVLISPSGLLAPLLCGFFSLCSACLIAVEDRHEILVG